MLAPVYVRVQLLILPVLLVHLIAILRRHAHNASALLTQCMYVYVDDTSVHYCYSLHVVLQTGGALSTSRGRHRLRLCSTGTFRH
jgi:hypothetical protein